MCIANMFKPTILYLHSSVLQVLLVGLCGLTNYKRLELLCTFALITVFVDYIIFMSFYPSGKYFYVNSISKAKGDANSEASILPMNMEHFLCSRLYKIKNP